MFAFNPIHALAFFAAGGCLCCSAQTNTCPKPVLSFFQPSLQLRQEPSALPAGKTLAATEPLLVKTPSSPPPAVNLELTTASAEGLHGSFVRPDEFYLVRAEQPAFDHGVNRFLDQVFRPEELKVGKLSVSSSITTAIKRKNPLCLLSPIVFQLSW